MRGLETLDRRTFLKGVGLVASAACLPACTTTTKRAAGNYSHKIVCANIRVPIEADIKTGDGWETRKELCADVLRRQRADIIGLQECYGIQLDYLKDKMPEFESYGLSYPDPVFKPGNAILFSRERYALISCGGFWLSETPHIAGSKSWDSNVARFANWIDLTDKQFGKQFRLWNTHLDHKSQPAREQQARVLCDAVDAAYPPTFPQLLLGDMNADIRNKAIAILKERGWKDTYAAVHGEKDPGPTFHRFIGPKYLEGKKDVAGKIDFIFARGPIKTLASEIVREGKNGRYPSDHYFISAEVEIGG